MSEFPPFYYRLPNPHSCRRAIFHNYKAPGRYLITISKAKEATVWSKISGNPREAGSIKVDPTLSGEIINDMILDLNTKPEFWIENHVVMPDHIHLLWRVRKWLDKDLGYYIGLFKSRCTKEWRQIISAQRYEEGSLQPRASDTDLFHPNFNDRIAFTDEITKRFSNYISDNPRKRLIAIQMPHLFHRTQRVRILDYEMDLYGNFQLLQHPVMAPGVVSRRYTASQRKVLERDWEEVIRSGGVMVSPFISVEEKRLMRTVIDNGGSIIRIIASGIGPKYKPSGEEFDLCAEGRCLHIGLPRPSAHCDDLRRSWCLELNALAHWLASHPAERMRLIL